MMVIQISSQTKSKFKPIHKPDNGNTCIILISGANENYELSAMLKERWSDTHIPVLVMSCIPNQQSPRVPCIDVIEALHLGKLNRPWQVRLKIIL